MKFMTSRLISSSAGKLFYEIPAWHHNQRKMVLHSFHAVNATKQKPRHAAKDK